MRLLATVQYKGTNYQGWQRQTAAPSIQEEIEKVISRILNCNITIQGSGRTDAGVHAIGQTFHFDIDREELDTKQLKYSINCLLPSDIVITSLEEVASDFHSRFNAKEKTYSYRIQFGERNPLTYETATWYPKEVDLEKMESALKLFEGTHNFQDFNSKEEDEEGFVRLIYQTTFNYSEKDKLLEITFRGNGFMRYQIRFMIGALLAIGIGKENESFIVYHLKNDKQREIISYKAPSNGLFLIKVGY